MIKLHEQMLSQTKIVAPVLTKGKYIQIKRISSEPSASHLSSS